MKERKMEIETLKKAKELSYKLNEYSLPEELLHIEDTEGKRLLVEKFIVADMANILQ